MSKTSEIGEEIAWIFKGKTLDTLIPPIAYAILNTFVDLNSAVIIALLIGFVLGIIRAAKKQKWQYAFVGIFGVLLASGYALFTQRAENYYLPGIIGNAFLLVLSIVSILIRKPLAAWASHISRGWPIQWFWRMDVRPAYTEVTFFWSVLILMRLLVSIVIYQGGNVLTLASVRFFTGWPLTILVLSLSYLYGMWRLKKLRGPGVDEYIDGTPPPFRGQNRGF